MSENLLCFYVAFLYNEGLAHASIKSYLSALRQLQKMGEHRIPAICEDTMWAVIRCVSSSGNGKTISHCNSSAGYCMIVVLLLGK